jgi:hypothetical protein
MIEELRALAEKATARPWRVRDDVIDFASWISAEGDAADLAVFGESWPNEHREEAEANAALIVALVNNLPAILSALEAVPAMKEALGGAYETLSTIVDAADEDQVKLAAREAMAQIDQAFAALEGK